MPVKRFKPVSQALSSVIFTLCISSAMSGLALSQEISSGNDAVNGLDELTKDWVISTSIDYSSDTIDYDNYITSKAAVQLRHKQEGNLPENKLIISGLVKYSYLRERTDTSDAFPILTRFPNHASGTTAESGFLDNLALGLTYAPTNWLTLYGQLEYHENIFETQNNLQLRKAYAIIGNLDASPFYAAIGRKTVNFGDFDQFNPFTHSVSNHFFRTESDGPIAELGYVSDTFEFTATAISGGRHLRVADTAGDGHLNNFALDGRLNIPVANGAKVQLAASYLHGTIYNHTLPHHPGPELACPVMPGQQGVPVCRGRNAAYDIRAAYYSDTFDAQLEYTSTLDPWPATNAKVETITAQARYKTELMGKKTHFSAAYSKANIGPFSMGGPGAPIFDSLDSTTVGIEVYMNDNFSVAAEYSRNNGFAPLVNVTTSSRDVQSEQFAVGARLVF